MGVNGATVNKTLWQIRFNSAFDSNSDLFPENTIRISGLTKVKLTEVSQQTHISPLVVIALKRQGKMLGVAFSTLRCGQF